MKTYRVAYWDADMFTVMGGELRSVVLTDHKISELEEGDYLVLELGKSDYLDGCVVSVNDFMGGSADPQMIQLCAISVSSSS